MRRASVWRPSKFVSSRGTLRGSRDPQAVGVGSRLTTDVIAGNYGILIAAHCRGRLLDLGCGEVPLFGAYRPFVTDVVCADWPASIHGNRHVDVLCDLTSRLPFATGSFDTILLSDVLEHIAEPLELCREIARLLAPGGNLIMNVPFFYWLHEQPYDYYRYTEFALRRFMAQTQLSVTTLVPVGGAPEIIVDILAKELVRIPKIGWRLSAALQVLAGWILRPPPGRLWTRRSAALFPLGYFLVAEKLLRNAAYSPTAE